MSTDKKDKKLDLEDIEKELSELRAKLEKSNPSMKDPAPIKMSYSTLTSIGSSLLLLAAIIYGYGSLNAKVDMMHSDIKEVKIDVKEFREQNFGRNINSLQENMVKFDDAQRTILMNSSAINNDIISIKESIKEIKESLKK